MTTVATKPPEWLTQALLALGYLPGAPTTATSDIDTEVANGTACPECGNVGRNYHPFTRVSSTGPRRYLAYAVCRRCAAVEEI